MIVGAIDIGSNSVRLLITRNGTEDIVRKVEVTGLARGVDANGQLAAASVAATLDVLRTYADLMGEAGVERAVAVATSASRDAANGAEVMDRFAAALGVRPEIISGDREALLSFQGALAEGAEEQAVVVDIGGGSTEIIIGSSGKPQWSHSYDIGSVRLTDRLLGDRPAPESRLEDARSMVGQVFTEPAPPAAGLDVVGVAGTFTSLAAMSLDLPAYDRTVVNGTVIRMEAIDGMIGRLAAMSIEQTVVAFPSLHPRRAPVILAGAIVASEALGALGATIVGVSERDLLDALADELVADSMS